MMGIALRELQIHFQNFILGKDLAKKDKLYSNICEQDLEPYNRLYIYQNNRIFYLTQCLKNLYPTIERIVGEECFDRVVYEYITHDSAISTTLHPFGYSFPDFLSTFTPMKILPYLPEVALLERALHEVSCEAESATFPLQKFRNIPAEQYENIKFKLNPANRLMEFQYPILDIWQLCQKDNSQYEEVDIDKGGERIIIIRKGAEIDFQKVGKGEFAFLSALNQGNIFKDACVCALEAEFNVNIETILQIHIVSNTIVNFSV